MTLPARLRPALCRASLRAGAGLRARGILSPLRDLATQLAFKVTGSPAVLFQAVRGDHRG
ncbi:hypothetical protein Tchl_0022 [Thauera chlorobenzoica]|uniref:Uncharacterized protein n=1 Tax=Thauera chlorobenzoica TaxID=96773 RepID=A0A1L6F7N7_9RHOO|nr:hypothetical protein Tchl_0022 [Thauera chlorobenzoica]